MRWELEATAFFFRNLIRDRRFARRLWRLNKWSQRSLREESLKDILKNASFSRISRVARNYASSFLPSRETNAILNKYTRYIINWLVVGDTVQFHKYTRSQFAVKYVSIVSAVNGDRRDRLGVLLSLFG